MPSTRPPRIRMLALAASCALTPWIVACAGGETGAGGERAAGAAAQSGTAAESGGEESEASRVRRYDVRGQVVQVPDPADPLSDLVIRHEAIPDFEGIDGVKVGMSSMAMPFPRAPQVRLEGIEPGDKVAFTFEVDWQADPAYRITRLEQLDDATELEFATKEPSPPTAPAAGGMIPPPEEYPVEEPPVV